MNRLLRLGLLSGLVLACAAPAGRAVNTQAVNRAIDKGVKSLRGMQRASGTWPYPDIGATALAGLTLLECGAAADDRAVVRAAEAVREASVNLTHNYSISLAILFLDRLGDPADVPLIESLTVRLLAGQAPSGGWNYDSPQVDAGEVRRLQSILASRKEPGGRRDTPRERRTEKDLPEAIQQQLADLRRAGPGRDVATDNSNTQFATLALWVARRHGLPVDPALKRVEARYRKTQNADGGWGYYYPAGREPTGVATASMTCAGLLGLAVAEATTGAKAAPDVTKDENLRKGLVALASVVGPTHGRGKTTGTIQAPRAGGRTYYFLWSVERVAVALDLKTIGKQDWYNWGAGVLLANQQADGSWKGSYADSGADTCFALLFLKRANLAPDLTARFTGKVKDPAERTLTGGGVSGEKLAGSITNLKPGIEDKGVKPGADGKYPDREPERKEARPIVKPPQDPPTRPAEPARPVDPVSTRMAADLAAATGARHNVLLQQMRDGKGPSFTVSLALAIPQLTGERQQKARAALVERLTRMKVETLTTYLEDDEPEIRRAAALACAQKEAKSAIPRLIPLLRHADGGVAAAAHEALMTLSGEDFGPAAGAGREEREQASRKWLEWWDKQRK